MVANSIKRQFARNGSIAIIVCWMLGVTILGTPSSATGAASTGTIASRQDRLEAARQAGDLQFQRRHIWKVLAELAQAQSRHSSPPNFESWYGEEYVFGDPQSAQLPKGMRGFSRSTRLPTAGPTPPSGDAAVLNYTLYNEAAYGHIRENQLFKASKLQRLNSSGAPDLSPGNRSVPAFPAQSMVLKTVWWPVASEGITALPVWDPELNPPRRGGNGYLTWSRIVAVVPSASEPAGHVDFATRSFFNVSRVGLERFYHIKVDASMAKRLMQDPESKKATLIALGRTIKPGDYLILVAANLATKELRDWIWAAVWWHDQPNQGPFAADRPRLTGAWPNYLMQVAFDSVTPVEADSGAHICFNPWLEGRFPDAGQGGGTVSNCMTCHRRASFPVLSFLPVTRGAPDLIGDPAFASGRLRTSFLWALSMHARE